jgi:hypothetical protein
MAITTPSDSQGQGQAPDPTSVPPAPPLGPIPPAPRDRRWYRRGWVIGLIALFVGIGLGVASAGSKKPKTTTVTSPAQTVVQTVTGPTETQTVTVPATGSTDTSTTDSTGSGPQTVAVDRGQTLKLSSLDAKVLGVSIQHQFSSDMGVKTATGRYVVIRAALTNRAHSPQSLSSSQTALQSASGDNYSEAFEVENGIDQNSLLWKTSAMNPLQPGQTVVGDFVYDVPNGVKVSNGVWGIVNFGDFMSDSSVSQLGGVRLGTLN